MIHRMATGRIITSEEWESWRKAGMSASDIAKILDIHPATVRYIGRKFRNAGVHDPQYMKRKPGSVRSLNTATDSGAYILGLLWGIFSIAEKGKEYWVRHREPWFVETVRDFLGISAIGHNVLSNTGNQTRLKISRACDIATIQNILSQHGWTPRKAEERPYPSGLVDDRGFIRAWVELHSSADITAIGRKRKEVPRLRIYGNWSLLTEINHVLAVGAGVGLRKLQNTSNKITKQLYYTCKNYTAVVGWLYQNATVFNPAAKEKFLTVAEIGGKQDG